MKNTKLILMIPTIVAAVTTVILLIMNHDILLSIQAVTVPALMTIAIFFVIIRFVKKIHHHVLINISLIASIFWIAAFGVNYFFISNEFAKWILHFWSLTAAALFGVSQILIWLILGIKKLLPYQKQHSN